MALARAPHVGTAGFEQRRLPRAPTSTKKKRGGVRVKWAVQGMASGEPGGCRARRVQREAGGEGGHTALHGKGARVLFERPLDARGRLLDVRRTRAPASTRRLVDG